MSRIENNYKVSGKKMTSRFHISRNHRRNAIKAGILPRAQEIKAEMRTTDEHSSKKIRQMERWGNRRWREFYKYECLSDDLDYYG